MMSTGHYVCPTCNGEGDHFVLDMADEGEGYARLECYSCDGTGRLPVCTQCGDMVRSRRRYGQVCRACRVRRQQTDTELAITKANRNL